MMSGYWPVTGVSVCVATVTGDVELLVPSDEAELAQRGWATKVTEYSPGSLDHQLDVTRALLKPLTGILNQLGLTGKKLAAESTPLFEGSSYSATFRFIGGVQPLVQQALPDGHCVPGGHLIERLRFSLTVDEISRMRLASAPLAAAYDASKDSIRPGAREYSPAQMIERVFTGGALDQPGVGRAGAFAWCMSGVNSSKAGGAFARTTNRQLSDGDLVLIHSNPYVDGYFGDVTRTYVIGPPDSKQQSMYEAIFEARTAALGSICAGARAADVDAQARDVISRHGYADYFTHGVGHSVGFSVISAEFPPRLNPTSTDILEVGCVINVEPSIYIPDYGGIRHCDVVVVAETGYELLTDFHQEPQDLIVV
jgi:Xaa-Pro aminopeptidase